MNRHLSRHSVSTLRRQRDQVQAGARVLSGGGQQRSHFALAGGGIVQVRADLQQLLPTAGIPGQEVHLETCGGADVGNLGASSLQLEQHAGLERASEISLS